MFCHLYWFAAATKGNFSLFWNSNIYVIKIGIRIRNAKNMQQNQESESADFGRIAIPVDNIGRDLELVQ